MLAAPAQASIIESVNNEVNGEMFYRPDFGGDKWSLTGRYGDCEDFALRKIERLRAAGIPARIGVYRLKDGTAHAIAIAAGVILDNRTNELRRAASVKFVWTGTLEGSKVYAYTFFGKRPKGTKRFVVKTVQ